MATRAPAASAAADVEDVPRTYEGITEPIVAQIRDVSDGIRSGEVKIIWWFVARIDEDEGRNEECAEKDGYGVELCGYEEVAGKWKYRLDREVVRLAVDVVAGSGY